MVQEMPDQLMEQRNEEYKNQLEQYLQHWIITDYQERADESWNRDYSSVDAFERSVEDNRARWKALLNPPDLRKTGPLTKTAHPLTNVTKTNAKKHFIIFTIHPCLI